MAIGRGKWLGNGKTRFTRRSPKPKRLPEEAMRRLDLGGENGGII
jgi:hypothetical protein